MRFALAILLILPFQAWALGSSGPKTRYITKSVAGFTVKIDPALERDPLTPQVLERLQVKLTEARVLSSRLAILSSKVTIWLSDSKKYDAMVYHASKEWLQQQGQNPDFAKGIEIANLKNYLAWNVTGDQPMMVVHELAHAYHDQLLSYNNTQVKAAYQAAMARKSYEKVRYNNLNGPLLKAYALNNEREYFAEITEAYFGRNDYYPFVRSDLQSFDTPGFALMQQTWGVIVTVPAPR